jgi:hypothetical protein
MQYGEKEIGPVLAFDLRLRRKGNLYKIIIIGMG